MQDGSIWVVFTDGETARICYGGQSITIVPVADAVGRSDGGDLISEVADLLSMGAREGGCFGLILVGTPHIINDLRDALSPESRALLIGEIVRGSRTAGSMAGFVGATCH
jgi:hypothetical protein